MVKLEGEGVVIYLNDEGRRILRQAGLSIADTGGFSFDVEEVSERGLWVRIDYRDGYRHALLIRWEYIQSVDVIAGEIKTEGLVN